MIKTVFSDKIVEFLETDMIQNLNILGIIENMDDIEYYVDDVENPKGVLVNRGYFNYIYTKEQSFIEDLVLNHFKEDFYGFSGLSSFVTEQLKPHFRLQWESPCELYYLPEGALDLTKKKHETRGIDIKDAQLIDDNYTYRGNGSLERIKDDISRRLSSAIYIEGDPVCWVLVHQDNSMGIMYTMEQHRGNGYAVDVTIDLCDKLIKNGKIPFLQINVTNHMSPGLAAKCGFIKHGRGNWFGGFKGIPAYFMDRLDFVYQQIINDTGTDEPFRQPMYDGRFVDYVLPAFDMQLEKNEILLELVPAGSSEMLESWVKLAVAGFSAENEKIGAAMLAAVMKNMERYKLFIAYQQHVPVSAGALFVQPDEASGICYMGSVPESQDKIGELVLLALLKQLKEADGDTVVYRAPSKFADLLSRVGGIRL